MHQCGSGLLDPVLENTIKKVEPLVKGKADPLVLASKCLNMIVDLSFMNSVTESGLVAKC
jgi:hypothetical protein